MRNRALPLQFTAEEIAEYNADSGLVALAAILGVTLKAARRLLVDFDRAGSHNVTTMRRALARLRLAVAWRINAAAELWPAYGLVRVQWDGPWGGNRAWHGRWVGAQVGAEAGLVFDADCMLAGGWVPFEEWRALILPTLIRRLDPRAYGRWFPTHVAELPPPGAPNHRTLIEDRDGRLYRV